jgi:hypothetical protein
LNFSVGTHIKALGAVESDRKSETILGTPRPFLRTDKSLSLDRNSEALVMDVRYGDFNELGQPRLSIRTALDDSGLFFTGSDIVTIMCLARWQVLACCEEELDDQYHLDEVVTFTGSPSHAQAASCVDYMRQTWPSTGEAMMKAFCRAIVTKACGEFQPSSSASLQRPSNDRNL